MDEIMDEILIDSYNDDNEDEIFQWDDFSLFDK